MNPFLRSMFVVARRDFLSIVATPTFFIFLLAPLFMVVMALAGGVGASQLADSARGAGRIVAVAGPADAKALRDADEHLRQALAGSSRPATLEIRQPGGRDSDPKAIANEKGNDTYAVMSGPLATPRIVERKSNSASGRYLALLATEALRARTSPTVLPTVTPQFEVLAGNGPGVAVRQSLGFGAVFIIFLLTLLLAGQTVSSLAEEKGNKVIEILAAAVPLESVFLGKLLGMLGVATLFILFWTAMTIVGGFIYAIQADPATLAASSTLAQQMMAGGPLAALPAPATGWPFFIIVGFLYFVLSFLLLGSVFLGIGAQAGTVREIQMLSLPITIFQVGVFSLSSAAAGAPGTTLATVAQIFPFSSPLAMAARAATDESHVIHLMAFGWQALWVGLVLALSVRLFRSGVLSGQSGWKFWRRADRRSK